MSLTTQRSRPVQRALDEQEAAYRAAAATERRAHLRALLLLALFVLVASIARAGISRAFVAGWWKQW